VRWPFLTNKSKYVWVDNVKYLVKKAKETR